MSRALAGVRRSSSPAMRWVSGVAALLTACSSPDEPMPSVEMPASEPEIAATPVALVDNAQTPYALAVESDFVYFADQDGGAILRVPASGGDAVALVSDLLEPADIAVSGGFVYFTELGPPWMGSVRRVASEGGPPRTLAGERYHPFGLVVDAVDAENGAAPLCPDLVGARRCALRLRATAQLDGAVYWTNFGSGDRGTIEGISVAGYPVALASGQSPRLGLALHEGFLYWTNYLEGTIAKMPIEGGTPVVLASGQDRPWLGLAVSLGYVYWTNSSSGEGTGSVARVGLDGGDVEQIANNQGLPAGIAVDDEFVYWTDSINDAVWRATLDGSEAIVLAADQLGAWDIVVTNDAVYWTNRRGGTVMRLQKTR